MRRASKKAFRYVFPVMFAAFVVTFFIGGNADSDSVQSNCTQVERIDSKMESGIADSLKLSSCNPKDNSKFFVHAAKAMQSDSKVDLIYPKSSLEKDDSVSSLTSLKAEYYEKDGVVNFIDDVSFEHTSGLSAKSPDALLATDTQNISGKNGINAKHRQSQITGNAYVIESKKGKLSVQGNACLQVCSSKSTVH